MERLTAESKVWDRDRDGDVSFRACLKEGVDIWDALKRLKEFEDTGLEPEEVRLLAAAEEKRKDRLADMRVGKTLDGVPVGLVLPKLDMEGEDAQTSADQPLIDLAPLKT